MTFVISLGGSLVVTDNGLNLNFLKELKSFIKQRVDLGDDFFIVVGGGITARQYIKAAQSIVSSSAIDQDLIGIRATHLNAELLRVSLQELAAPEIIINPEKIIERKYPVVVAGGYQPGWSTDYVSVLLARNYQLHTLINLTNIDYVFDCDPKIHADAKKIEKINWKDFCSLVGDNWEPGMNTPFDPIASRLASSLKLKVAILNGNDFLNINNFLEDQEFKGTIIEDE